METERLLENLRHGNSLEAFEAAKSISNVPAKRIIEVLDNATSLHNREAAAYALSLLPCKDKTAPLQALLNIFNDAKESPAVRGQALEGLGIHKPTARHKLWPDIERAVLAGLKDEAIEVRFWACYAAGTL